MIVGGFEVKINEVPYQAAIFKDWQLICGGTIIGARWILTSFHCVRGGNLTQYTVVVGRNDPYTGTKLNVERIYKHPGSTNGKQIDVALLKLNQTLRYNDSVSCLPLAMSKQLILVGKPATISGYGITSESSKDYPLKAAIVNVLQRKYCEDAYPYFMQKFMVCAGFKEGQVDSCQGDSGGPLVVDGKLAGVTYFGKGCGRPYNPGVYIGVPWIQKWIRKIVTRNGEQRLC